MSARILPSAPWPMSHYCENTVEGRGFDRPTATRRPINPRRVTGSSSAACWGLFVSLVVGGWVFATYLLKPLLALAIEAARAIGMAAS